MTVEAADHPWRTGRRGKRARRIIGESDEEYLAAALVMLVRSGGDYPFPAAAAATKPIVDHGDKNKKTHEETSHDHENKKKKKKTHEETSRDHENSKKKKTHEETSPDHENSKKTDQHKTSHDHENKKKKVDQETSHHHENTNKKTTHEETSRDHENGKKTDHHETSHDHENNKEKVDQETSHDRENNKKAADQETSSHHNSSYRCSVCNKEFSSYQALGGHKTSHRQNNPSTATTTIAVEPPTATTPASTNAVHECTTCHRRFPTGLALGGHKRKHYKGVLGRGKSGATISSASAVTVAAASDNCGAASTHDHHILGAGHQTPPFDLNVPASPETEIDLALRF